MASTLSSSAIHRIISLVLHAPVGEKEKKNANYGLSYAVERVNSKWNSIYKLYWEIKPAPPLGYVDSLALALFLKDQVDDKDVRAIFAHGKPLEFWGCPPLLVPKIVEAFRGLQKEPTYLDVTITALSRFGATSPSEAWPQAYRFHLPCHTCTRVEAVEERSIPRESSNWIQSSVDTVNFAVEKFHVSSNSFRKRLTVGLHCQLTRGMRENEQFSDIHKITIRLDEETCSPQGRQCDTASRSSATLLLLSDLAPDVFGFLERAHIGSSLLANRSLHDLICLLQLKQRLPVHRLTCTLENEVRGLELVVRHRQRDLPYTDVRRFKIPSIAGAENDCDLIRHYLSNSHLAELRPPRADYRFTIKMLASLAACNVSVRRVELYTAAERLSDYRSMDAVFRGLTMSDLDLSCAEHRFFELVKTTDFFRTPTVQRLRKLRLSLNVPWFEKKPRGYASSKSPLWLAGISLLRNCGHYRVNYETDRHLRSIERKFVRICEDFERGVITDTVEHFQFNTSREINYAFSRDNLLVSGAKVECESEWDPTRHFEWDVYRFRNAITHEYLTACVGRNSPMHRTRSILHIVKGEVYPGASFADY